MLQIRTFSSFSPFPLHLYLLLNSPIRSSSHLTHLPLSSFSVSHQADRRRLSTVDSAAFLGHPPLSQASSHESQGIHIGPNACNYCVALHCNCIATAPRTPLQNLDSLHARKAAYRTVYRVPTYLPLRRPGKKRFRPGSHHHCTPNQGKKGERKRVKQAGISFVPLCNANAFSAQLLTVPGPLCRLVPIQSNPTIRPEFVNFELASCVALDDQARPATAKAHNLTKKIRADQGRSEQQTKDPKVTASL